MLSEVTQFNEKEADRIRQIAWQLVQGSRVEDKGPLSVWIQLANDLAHPIAKDMAAIMRSSQDLVLACEELLDGCQGDVSQENARERIREVIGNVKEAVWWAML